MVFYDFKGCFSGNRSALSCRKEKRFCKDFGINLLYNRYLWVMLDILFEVCSYSGIPGLVVAVGMARYVWRFGDEARCSD